MKYSCKILIISLVSLISLISLAQTKSLYKIENDLFKTIDYTSSLTEEQRNEYYEWVSFRNSFEYSKDDKTLELSVKYFTPEADNYFKNLLKYGAPFFFASAVILASFIAYLVARLILNKCLGPKKYVENSYVNFTWILIIVGFTLSVGFYLATLVNGVKQK